GINFFTARILSNAVGAICGMVEAYLEEKIEDYSAGKILIALSMMGTTTQGALRAKTLLEENGFQVISFHQNGTGGIAMEEMIGDGIFQGVFDLSLHEVGDRELGGLHGAVKPIRLETAGEKGIPQVVVPGCLVYYVAGPVGSLSSETRERKYFIHSPQLTLVRATPQELAHIGKIVAKKLNLAKGPLKVFIPLKGFCSPDKEGSELFDPEGNKAFITSLKEDLGKNIPIIEVDAHINDPEFIDLAIEEFIKMMAKNKKE
ncbi:MAG: Tm-1-like ATP-binding domain-containing protein, partial [Actinobacteria bacterium]|nr:Tm-1-like ATP-binding domain-containing protein [Actinomycetota bacterium]